jgi:uncharacterized beta-barrel protein YwiB (DUF1934 family)
MERWKKFRLKNMNSQDLNNWKKSVLINIRGIQTADDGQRDTTELFTQGFFYHKNNSYYLSYEESEATGFEGSRTTLKIEGNDRISLIRHGNTRSNLIIERGGRNVGYYSTMQGELMIGVSAAEIDIHLNENGGNLYFKYSLDINTTHVSDNEVYVDVQENTAE